MSPRPDDLRTIWRDIESHALSLPVVSFYGHSHGPHKCFSNFFEHAPFEFVLPPFCGPHNVAASGLPVRMLVMFTEKAIMLCKAALMNDLKTYDQIVRCRTPAEAKQLGRQVSHWNQSIWDRHVCDVAKSVVLQKFTNVPGLAEILLATGDRVIAEMTHNDFLWGTGCDIGHPNEGRPERWRGANILGWALMSARSELRTAVGALKTAQATNATEAGEFSETDHDEGGDFHCTSTTSRKGRESRKENRKPRTQDILREFDRFSLGV